MAPKYVIIVRERYETYGLKAWQFLKQGKEIWSTEDVETAKQKYLDTLNRYPYNCVKIMHDLTPFIDADFHGCTPSGQDEPTYNPTAEELVYNQTSPVYIDEMLLMEGFEPHDVDIEDGPGYDPINEQANVDGSYNQGSAQTDSIIPVDVDIED